MFGACSEIQAIADAQFRQDIAWVRWVRFELASQQPYCRSQVPYPVNTAPAPHDAQDFAMCNYPAGTFG
jgi:hypothetical protein